MMHMNMQSFLDFAEQQPPVRKYEYPDSDVCACAQFAIRIGAVTDWKRRISDSHIAFWNVADDLAEVDPWNFGALAERIREHIAEGEVRMIQPDMGQFLAFIESKPPERAYEYEPVDDCACGQFAFALGVDNWIRRGGFWDRADNLARDYPRTFGDLAGRVRAYIGG